jgi:hypothetical protein
MQKQSFFVITLALIPFLAFVSAQIPYFPNVSDPNFPLGSRCIDYCGDLTPAFICPDRPTDVACLCEVYDIRLPAVLPLLCNCSNF